jgi:hypothetical protein
MNKFINVGGHHINPEHVSAVSWLNRDEEYADRVVIRLISGDPIVIPGWEKKEIAGLVAKIEEAKQ